LLLGRAREQRLELCYARICAHFRSGGRTTLGRFPPEEGQFGLQSALYHSGLADIFELELADAAFGVPYDELAWVLRRLGFVGSWFSFLFDRGGPNYRAEPAPALRRPRAIAIATSSWSSGGHRHSSGHPSPRGVVDGAPNRAARDRRCSASSGAGLAARLEWREQVAAVGSRFSGI
jgi:hypothetical protein